MKFDTVDYVLEICPQTEIGDDRISGVFLGKYVKYNDVCDFLYF